MNSVIYRITYTPHLGTKYPKFYIGSKHNYNGSYYGSVSSERIFEYTDGFTLKDWWAKKVSETPSDFTFEILSKHDATPHELVLIERSIQEEFDVLSDEYFNQCLAARGFVSTPKSESFKKHISVKTKEYWDSPAGLEKRKRLSNRNKQLKSEQMKELWSNPTPAMLARENHGRPKGAKDVKPRKKRVGKPRGPYKRRVTA